MTQKVSEHLAPPPGPSEFPHLTLVIGGARSGKSRHAEDLARLADRPKTYIATAQAWDAEMRARIDSHRDDRGPDWHTIEAPMDLPAALAAAPPGVILIDCATLWLTNVILAQEGEGAQASDAVAPMAAAHSDTVPNTTPKNGTLATQTAALLRALAHSPNPVIIVTNELGLCIVPENALARRFRDAQGRLNQALAAQADLVVLVVAGLPLTLKGRPPTSIA